MGVGTRRAELAIAILGTLWYEPDCQPGPSGRLDSAESPHVSSILASRLEQYCIRVSLASPRDSSAPEYALESKHGVSIQLCFWFPGRDCSILCSALWLQYLGFVSSNLGDAPRQNIPRGVLGVWRPTDAVSACLCLLSDTCPCSTGFGALLVFLVDSLLPLLLRVTCVRLG